MLIEEESSGLGFNLKKQWMKQQKRRLETHYSEKKVS